MLKSCPVHCIASRQDVSSRPSLVRSAFQLLSTTSAFDGTDGRQFSTSPRHSPLAYKVHPPVRFFSFPYSNFPLPPLCRNTQLAPSKLPHLHHHCTAIIIVNLIPILIILTTSSTTANMSGKSFVRPSGYEHHEVFCSDTIRRRGNTATYKVECHVRAPAALSFPSSRDTCSHFLQPCGAGEPAGDLDWWAPPAPVQPKMVTLFPPPSTDAASLPFSRLFIVSVHGGRSSPPPSLSLSLHIPTASFLFSHNTPIGLTAPRSPSKSSVPRA